MNNERRVIIYRDEDGFWAAECPSLPGCFSQGETKVEAVENIREAMALYIESLEAHNEPIPEDTYDSFMIAV